MKTKMETQLGVSSGTARWRLLKMTLFRILQKTELDVCYRCGGKILRWQDLSLDHIKDWLDIDPALFWDTDNIAFSHLRCNNAACGRRHPLTKEECIKGGQVAGKLPRSPAR